MLQKSIEKDVIFEGVGLHSGKSVRMKLSGAPDDTGIVFRRIDLEGYPSIRAHISEVTQADRCTIIGKFPVQVGTTEHLLAAAYGMGIDNLLIEMDAGEPPALDGSALPFVHLIQDGGIISLGAPRKYLSLPNPVMVSRGDSLVIALPSDELKITYLLDYLHPLVGTQMVEAVLTEEEFTSRIAPARTYGFWEEVKSLWERNLALGGNLDNAIIVRQDGYSTPLRFPDELVRHKVLDFLGDIALLGKFLKAHLIAVKAGHKLHIELIHKIFEEAERFGNKGYNENSPASLSLLAGRSNS